MEPALTHRALIKHDEVMKASMAARSRAISVYWLALLLAVGLVLAIEWGHLFAFWFVQQLPFEVVLKCTRSLAHLRPLRRQKRLRPSLVPWRVQSGP